MIQPKFRATGIAKMEVIKAADRQAADGIAAITDPDALRRIAQERHIAFAPTVSVEQMKKRLLET